MFQRTHVRALRSLLLLICLSTAAGSAPARADLLEFKNGDRLSGTILGMKGGAISLRTEMLGEIQVPLANVRTFSTAAPIALHLSDGTVLNEAVSASGEREIRAAQSSRVVSFDSFDAINPPEPAWHGAISAGATFERGNSIEDSANLRVDTQRDFKIGKISLYGEYDGERTTNSSTGEGTTTDREILAGVRLDRAVNERWSWFARTDYEKDGNEDLDLRARVGFGPSYRWWQSDRFGLTTDLGLTWISARYGDPDADEDYAATVAGWNLYWQFARSSRFFHRGTWEPSLEDFGDLQLLRTTTGLRTNVSARFFLEGKLVWEWNSEPSSDADRQDTDYIFALGYEF